MIFTIAVLSSLSIAIVSPQREINVRTCDDSAKGKLDSITVTPCDSDPCKLEKKSNVSFGFRYISDQDSATAELRGTAIGIFSLKKSIAGLETDLCKVLGCPIHKDKEYSGTMGMQVPNTFFTRYATVKVEVLGDSGLSACIKFPVEIVAKKG